MSKKGETHGTGNSYSNPEKGEKKERSLPKKPTEKSSDKLKKSPFWNRSLFGEKKKKGGALRACYGGKKKRCPAQFHTVDGPKEKPPKRRCGGNLEKRSFIQKGRPPRKKKGKKRGGGGRGEKKGRGGGRIPGATLS